METLDPTLVNAFQTLLTAVVVALVALLTYAVKKGTKVAELWLEQKLGTQTYSFLKDYAMTTVRFLEQQPMFKDLTGPQKKEEAVSSIVLWCQDRNIPVDHDLIDKLIEEAVNVMNASISGVGKE